MKTRLLLVITKRSLYKIVFKCVLRVQTDLIPSGHVLRHVLEAAHHPVISEVVRERLGPFGQQLHQLWRYLTETDLEKNHHTTC